MEENGNLESAAIKVFEKQRIIRFNDLGELFIARVLLGLVERPTGKDIVKVQFNLSHLFTGYGSQEEIEALSKDEFEDTDRITELMCDALEGIFGKLLNPRSTSQRAFDYYVGHIRTRLKWLMDGDSLAIVPMIEAFDEVSPGNFIVTLYYDQLVEGIRVGIGKQLDLSADLLSKVKSKVSPTTRIDYRKELDILIQFLDERQKITGEVELQFSSRDMPFRHAILTSGDIALPSPGTCGPSDRLLLPVFLEATGLLDITHIGVCSSPSTPRDVVIKYSIRRPAHLNIFEVESDGLSATERRSLNEIQLSVFQRMHKKLQERYVFTARSTLEKSFASISSWFIRKISYSLEESSFLGRPAMEWLRSHENMTYTKMEDDFFLPFLHERLFDAFGDRIKKKPEMFGGEIDLLIDNIPIELKVRRGAAIPLVNIIDETYRPASQASAYAAQTRLAIVCVLDLPDATPQQTNIDSCVVVLEREVGSEFPTCVVVYIFHCHHPKPSSMK